MNTEIPRAPGYHVAQAHDPQFANHFARLGSKAISMPEVITHAHGRVTAQVRHYEGQPYVHVEHVGPVPAVHHAPFRSVAQLAYMVRDFPRDAVARMVKAAHAAGVPKEHETE